MQYTLMHKNISVAELDLDEATGSIRKVNEIWNEAHLPIGVGVRNGIADRVALNEWWIDRAIPASRSGVRRALEILHISNTKILLTKCFGLSLSDQYWIRPQDSDVAWEMVNFFDNSFSEDIGNVLMGKAEKTDDFDFRSPDNTSDGCLKKRWKIINGKRCLVKAGSNPFMQQPFNEVVASMIAEKLNIPHVPYMVIWDEEAPYSVCEDFITPDTELVSAWRVMQIAKKDNSTSVYRHYLNCCEMLGIEGVAHAVDQMIVLDYILANEDRHQNNFGVVRDANTLEWIGPAPIFDSGSSLGYDKLTSQILSGRGVECKPFKKTHEEQLKLVTSFDWIDFSKLRNIRDDVCGIFDEAGEFMEETRKNAILNMLMHRIEQLEAIALTSTPTNDNIEHDVDTDIAAEYGG